ncbi:MAG: hypothetical protein FJX57_13690 [Alphaproteobacteria bacterium]|nr:hypothetical protein [Alphaproteobacteria bacterium]
MIVGRVIGWLCVLIAAAGLAYEAAGWLRAGAIEIGSTGELWYALHPASLNALQAGVQRNVLPWLWDPVILSLLLWPPWIIFGAPGIVVLWLCWPRRSARRR